MYGWYKDSKVFLDMREKVFFLSTMPGVALPSGSSFFIINFFIYLIIEIFVNIYVIYLH